MPRYLYRCPRCDNQYAARHSIEDSDREVCACGTPMQRIYTAPAISFRGDGFYRSRQSAD